MGAVRFQVVGKVGGVPRVILDHVTRTQVDQMPRGRSRRRAAVATASRSRASR